MPPASRQPLTKRIVESAAASGERYRRRDNNPAGLFLGVSASGAKSCAIVWGRGQHVRERLGHADIRMTLRYPHPATEHKAAAVERVVQ